MEVADIHTHVPNVEEHTLQLNATTQNQNTLSLPIQNQATTIANENLVDSSSEHCTVTPVNPEKLASYLQGYDESINEYLIDGFKSGFSLQYQGQRQYQQSPNLKSALDNPCLVQEKISKEIDLGRIKGPFSSLPLPNLKLSPLGLVPKKTPGEFRLIHHLSYPRCSSDNSSVNEGISSEFSTVQYAGIEDAINQLKKCGSGSFMAKTDIKSAFRIIPVHPSDHDLLGFSFRNSFYYDTCLPMGCSSSCKIFETFSSALEWVAIHKLGCSHVVHILDDFFFIEATYEKALSSLNSFIHMCEIIGVPLAEEKTFLPSQCMSFVGIELNSLTSTASLPQDKVLKATNVVESFLQKDKSTLKEFQSLIGLLNFACSVVIPGRPFLRRLINLTIGVPKSFHHIRITSEVKADLLLWLKFLQTFNGRTIFMNEQFQTSAMLELYTDASTTVGFGAVFKSKWLCGRFPGKYQQYNIAVLEFYPILLSVFLWGHLWANHVVIFYTDNEAIVSVINKQTSKDNMLLKMVRCLVLKCLKINLSFRAKHVPGHKNSMADSLSRLQIQRFKDLAPKADPLATAIPVHLIPENFFPSLDTY